MPNKGYPLGPANFIKKFSLRVNENDVIRDLKRIRAHCVKHGPQLTGEIGPIRDVSLYEKLKKEFNGLMTSRMENPTVLRDKRNQRYTEHSINKEAVSTLKVIIKEYLIDHPVNGMTYLAIIYQTAQDCHEMVAYKPPNAPVLISYYITVQTEMPVHLNGECILLVNVPLTGNLFAFGLRRLVPHARRIFISSMTQLL
ncbi:reverse transcriptase homolog [Babesia caballi]|uniref:Reverse transcriptase homolog n=1 Tax=Babesia caballi TaxID=5871 RepID=A0AAV4LMZ3_BABCB|nr:reverse transcriptase homolog [Babesia caballi]